jgi:hypothetical protein
MPFSCMTQAKPGQKPPRWLDKIHPWGGDTLDCPVMVTLPPVCYAAGKGGTEVFFLYQKRCDRCRRASFGSNPASRWICPYCRKDISHVKADNPGACPPVRGESEKSASDEKERDGKLCSRSRFFYFCIPLQYEPISSWQNLKFLLAVR